MDYKDVKQNHPTAFPTLDDEQLRAITEFAKCKTYSDGETLFHAGEREFKFHVVRSGEVAIVDHSGDEARTLVVQTAREFTGDIANLTGRPANADGIARGTVEVLEVSADDLRRIINEQPKLSDTILQAFIARWQILNESDYTGLRVIGSRYSTDTFRIRDFLAKNKVLFTWIDVEVDPQVDELLKRFSISEADTPVVAYGDEWLLRNPSTNELAECIGIKPTLTEAVYDLAVVGAGPAGLAAAVYGSSEGLKTVVLDSVAPGGQAGTSTRIENYLGFPMGVSGEELAGRAFMQAQKFGAQLSAPSEVVRLDFDGAYPVLHLEDGHHISAKCLLIATGAEYRKLDVEGRARFDGAGVYYAAGQIEAQACGGAEVVVVGGGNSAGQAVVYLAGYVRRVLLLIRGDDLGKNMSRYLVQRIEQAPNVELLTNSTVTRMTGDAHLERVEITNHKTSETRNVETPAVFTFIGAVPRTSWLPAEIETDDKGFVKTGTLVEGSRYWTLKRQPYLLETSCPGVIAAGDVRLGSSKRVAAAVGEGAMAVQLVHQYLQEMRDPLSLSNNPEPESMPENATR